MVPKLSHALIFDLRDVLFSYNPEHRNTAQQFAVITEGLEILMKCAAQIDEYGRKKHKLYVLSNGSIESYHNFIENFPDIFSLFDGIVMSGTCGLSKPDYRIYQYIMQKYSLNPESCIFIDDKEPNVLAAKAAGMDGIVCSSHQILKQELKLRNVF